MTDVRVGWLVTNGQAAAPSATFLPVIWRDNTVIAHFAKGNPHWREIGAETADPSSSLAPMPTYPPRGTPQKAEHGKVVPTWNYSAVHLTGLAQVHHDPEWLRMAVEESTGEHEGQRHAP